ncbi:DUF1177 domain-containing protein [Zobellella maritima]|uniref:DUF1177 domain-containing protein n=1 Tax=Zobellella maritima TaxID=2059725 RepID=UPI000E309779|nr:DUF1177 domain-containing protein [Zobellella maritima]
MSLQQTLTVYELLDGANVTGDAVLQLFEPYREFGVEVSVEQVTEESRADFIRILVKGENGKSNGGSARTLGLVGRNGAIGARPDRLGMVSDADGAVTVIAAALKLAQTKARGDRLEGDVIVTTHLSTNAEIVPREPVDFMGMPVSSTTMNHYEVDAQMDAILSVDTSKGNRIFNHRGFGITPTAKEGYVLRVSNDLLRIFEQTTGELPRVMPITTQDITAYDNGVYHINSIMQPTVATSAPVVGVPIVAQGAVAGSASGASHEIDIAEAVRFCVEVAIQFGDAKRYTCEFYDDSEYQRLISLYGSLSVLQTEVAKLENTD